MSSGKTKRIVHVGDEPTAALDMENGEQVMSLLLGRRAAGIALYRGRG